MLAISSLALREIQKLPTLVRVRSIFSIFVKIFGPVETLEEGGGEEESGSSRSG